MPEDYRIVTEFEVFQHYYLTPYKILMDKAIEMGKAYKERIPETQIVFDINAVTFSLSKMWQDHMGFIEAEVKKRQAEIDKVQDKINKGV